MKKIPTTNPSMHIWALCGALCLALTGCPTGIPAEPTSRSVPNVPVSSKCSASAVACYDELTGKSADLVRYRATTRWSNTSLTYTVANFLPDCESQIQLDLVTRAFTLWSDVSALSFTQSDLNPDITITFVSGEHNDMFPFEGANGTLGHAFFPSSLDRGQVHMNSDRQWSECHNNGINLFTALVHEIGHALGVEHARNNTSVMSQGYVTALSSLTDEDVDAIRRLYGDEQGKTIPAAINRELGDEPNFDDENDSDFDNIPDSIEILVFDTNPFQADTDNDGVNDFTEIFIDGTDPLHAPVIVFTDSDGDGLSDDDEILLLGTDPFVSDTDGDGLNDLEDAFPLNPFFGDTNADPCDVNGWYGDYVCDTICLLADPDCSDNCLNAGFYSNFQCDTNCPLPDPDCEDICTIQGLYGNGVCDTVCDLFDPDCAIVDVSTDDICATNFWYSDTECDTFCPLPDPDCEDICVIQGLYGDGICDTICLQFDFDCNNLALCDDTIDICIDITNCSNDCSTAFDGECDDGGIGADFAICAFGTDCADCGQRDASGF